MLKMEKNLIKTFLGQKIFSGSCLFTLKRNFSNELGAECTQGCQKYHIFIKFQQEPCLSSLESSITIQDIIILHTLVQVQLLFQFSDILVDEHLVFLEKEASKIDFQLYFSNFWNPGPNLDPLNLQKMPSKNLILACLERSPSTTAGKKDFQPFFVSFSSYWDSKMVSHSKL